MVSILYRQDYRQDRQAVDALIGFAGVPAWPGRWPFALATRIGQLADLTVCVLMESDDFHHLEWRDAERAAAAALGVLFCRALAARQGASSRRAARTFRWHFYTTYERGSSHRPPAPFLRRTSEAVAALRRDPALVTAVDAVARSITAPPVTPRTLAAAQRALTPVLDLAITRLTGVLRRR